MQTPFSQTHDSPYRSAAAEAMYAAPPKSHPRARPREVAAALGLVAVADFALWHADVAAPRGLGAAAFFVGVPALLIAASRGRRTSARFFGLVATLLLIALRCAYATTPNVVALGCLAIFALVVTMRGRATFLTDVALSFAATAATLGRRYRAFGRGVRRSVAEPRGASLGPVALPVGLVAGFTCIFAFANPLVGKWIDATLGSIAVPAPLRVLLWVALFAGALLLLRPALRRTFTSERLDLSSVASGTSTLTASSGLIAVNVLFLAYNALDAKFLWLGSPPAGMSERTYAHEGAAWLTVAIAALTLVVGVLFRGALAHDVRARVPRALAFVWLAQGAFLALGTYRRLWIHIQTSGLSSLRILGVVGTSIVVVGLVQMAMKLWRTLSFTWLLRRQLDAIALGLLAFSLAPTHLLAAKFNVASIRRHAYQVLVNVEEEAAEPESVVALLPLIDHDDPRIRAGVAAILLNERDHLAGTMRGWRYRDADFATRRAWSALDLETPKLEAVLGDVDREDAITPFEYVRNSSIEGVVASVEVARVELAPTRAAKVAAQKELLARWLQVHVEDAHATDSWEVRSMGICGAGLLYSPLVTAGGVPRTCFDLIVPRGPEGQRLAALTVRLRSEPVLHASLSRSPERPWLEIPLRITEKEAPNRTWQADAIVQLARDPNSNRWHVIQEDGLRLFP